MKQALLWYDDDPNTTLDEKVQRATKRHKQKYGTTPNFCYVHPSALADGPQQVNCVRVASLPTVLHGHFWIGVAGSVEVIEK